MPPTGSDQAAPPPFLAAARQRFINLAEARVLAIEAIRQDLGRGTAIAGGLAQIAAIAHQVAGVAATLGYADLGSRAGRIDRMFKAVDAHQPAEAIWRQAQPELEALLDALEAVLDD